MPTSLSLLVGQTTVDIGSPVAWIVGLSIFGFFFFLIFFASRYRKFRTNEFVIHLRGGKVKSSGLGGKVILLPLIDEIVVIPTTTRQTSLQMSERVLSREFQDISIEGFLYWKVVDPKVAYTAVSWEPRSPDYVELVLKNACESIIRTTCAHMAIEKIIRERREIIEDVSNYLTELTTDWGIVIESIEIKEVNVLDKTLKNNMEAVKKMEEERKARLAKAEAEEIARMKELEVAQKVGVKDQEIQRDIDLKHKAREILVAEQEKRRMEIAAEAVRQKMVIEAKGKGDAIRAEKLAEAEAEAAFVRQKMNAQAEGFREQVEAMKMADEKFLAIKVAELLPEIFKNLKPKEMIMIGEGQEMFTSLASAIIPFLKMLPNFNSEIQSLVSAKAGKGQ
ncbi:MAG: SPFH domain-containing protein [Promethearchaeota archaeon]